MKSAHTLTDRLERLRRCCDAYGAETARWPADERAALEDILDLDEAAEIRAEAQTLDAFLNAASLPRMSEDFERRLAASYVPPAAARNFFDRVRDRLPQARLLPAGLFAGLGALGLVTGMATAQPAMTPETEALAYLDFYALPTLDDNGGLSWDAE